MDAARGAGAAGKSGETAATDSETVSVKIPPASAGAWSCDVQPWS